MERKTNILQRIDWIIVLIYLILVIYGWMNIYSSAYKPDAQFDFTQRYAKQLLWIIVAIIIIVTIFFVDNHVFSTLSYLIYGFFILMLVAVLIFGSVINDSRSWIVVGDFRIQPSEFAKFATALALAKFMNKENFSLTKDLKNLIISGVIILIPVFFILLQGDVGSALVYLVFLLVLYREGLPFVFIFIVLSEVILFILSFFVNYDVLFSLLIIGSFIYYAVITKDYRGTFLTITAILMLLIVFWAIEIFSFTYVENNYIYALVTLFFFIFSLIKAFKKRFYLPAFISGIVLFLMLSMYSSDFVFNNILQDHHRSRINVFLGFEQDLKGIGYNVNQSKIAIGSGGFFGKGYLKGTQTKYDFVPEQDTDFIFCTVGEEMGFVGTAGVLILFAFLVLRIMYLAEKQRSPFSRIYGYSFSALLFFHFSINVAMTIGLAPVIGIPLPFFSYRGSSLWSFTILLFIFVKLNTVKDSSY